MQAATTIAETANPTVQPREVLWLEFYRALAQRNFVRAVTQARRLGNDEERIRRIERDALRQFLAEYQNFDGATRLCADYCISAEELSRLTAEVLKRQELEAQTTFTMQSGQLAHLSIAQQIRNYARRQIESLKQRERRAAAEEGVWSRLVSTVKDWRNRLSTPWRGGFPQGGPAYS
jgi:hypothetical protein